MPLPPFKSSEPLTVGTELELQLVSLSDFDLIDASPDLLAFLGREPFPGNITPEITESMIEVSTHVQTRFNGVLGELDRIRDALVRAGDRLNVGICGGGTHPFQRWPERKIYSRPRFKKVSALYGYLAKRFTVFGQHVHIGCTSGDEALFLLHALNRYVPHFVALSASSPFSLGTDTLFHSARLNSVSAFPLSGVAPFILDWARFEEDYFAKMELTGIVASMKDFYWDIRPKPEFGTIELRVCDTPLCVRTAAALACYLQALCRFLLERSEPPPSEDDYFVYAYNRFQASRFGLEGTIVHPKTHEALSLREDILDVLERVEPHANVLESSEAIDHLRDVVHEGNDATYLREKYATSGSVEGIVDAAIACFRTDTGRRPR